MDLKFVIDVFIHKMDCNFVIFCIVHVVKTYITEEMVSPTVVSSSSHTVQMYLNLTLTQFAGICGHPKYTGTCVWKFKV